jgi:hypothetical protein
MTDAQQRGDNERPWEQPGAVRRDCEPHRARFLRGLGIIGVVLAYLAVCTGIGSPLGMVVGITVWVMAARDLAKMRKKRMDPAGKSDTIVARDCAIATVVLSVVFGALWACIVFLVEIP